MDKEKLAQMERTMLVFGQGKWTCIGMHVSLDSRGRESESPLTLGQISTCETQKLIPTIVRTFEVALAELGWEWKYVELVA